MMSCGHRVGTIEKVVKALDENAEVSADLGAREFRVQSGTDERAIDDAIRAAGYENSPIDAVDHLSWTVAIARRHTLPRR